MEGDPLDLVGDLIDGQYRVDSFVGVGDLSVVYRGFHLGVEAEVAIKFLDLPTTLDAALVGPLVRSFREGSKLHYRLARGHLHIAQCIGSGQTMAPRTGALMPYLVREWLQGQSLGRDLADRHARGLTGRSLADAIDLFRGAMEGLAYAHRQGVPHLALNPSNLFLARSGTDVRLKILDFGVANAMNEHAWPLRAKPPAARVQAPGLRVLVPAYAAPEQLDAAIGQSGTWTDVYAMALIFVEALVDRPMFGDAPPTLDKALHAAARKITLPGNLDPRIAHVLARALSFAPRERQPSAGIFLKEFLEVVPVRSVSIIPRSTSSPKVAAVRAPTLVGLQEARPSPPIAAPPNVGPPRKKEESIEVDVDDAPTHHEMHRILTPAAEPIFVQAFARAHDAHARGEAPAPPPPKPAPPILPAPQQQAHLPPAPQLAPVAAPRPIDFVPPPPSYETGALPPFMASRRKGAVIIGGASAAILALIVVIWFLSRRSEPRVAVTPKHTASATLAPSPVPTPTPTPTMVTPPTIAPTPTVAATTAPTVVATPATATTTTTKRATTSRHRFTVASGRAALDAAGETLAECKRPRGHFGPGSVRVTFSPDTGKVIHVMIGPPYAGSDQGRCIVAKYRGAHVDPFRGRPSAINYVFKFPR